MLPISVLSSRVHEPTKDDWRKLKRMVDYFKATVELHLVLCLENKIPVAKWFVYSSFAVHSDFRSHTGSCLKFSDIGGAMIVGSLKQT